ncbi:hypothetical protein H0X06_04090 [Candidatus Dependentiae bacterium]|nr:hypothetical protein [Candidatus Dependentiae bacterium]
MNTIFMKLSVHLLLIIGSWSSSAEGMSQSKNSVMTNQEKIQNIPKSAIKIVFNEQNLFFYTIEESSENHSIVKIVSPNSLSHTELIRMYFEILPTELQRSIAHLMISDVLDCNFEFYKNVEKCRSFFLAHCSSDFKNALTVSNGKNPQLRNIETAQIECQLKGHAKIVTSLAFSPNCETILTGSADETARLWNTETGKTVVTFHGNTSTIRSVAYTPQGETIFTGSEEGVLSSYNALSGNLLLRIKCSKEALTSLEVSCDGELILIGSKDGKTVDLWDIAMKKNLFHRDHLEEITSTKLSPNKKIILTTQKKIVHLWSVASKKQVGALPHPHKILCSAFSPDSTQLLTGCSHSEVCLWDLTSGVLVLRFICRSHSDIFQTLSFFYNKLSDEELLGEIKSVSFSSDAKTIFVGAAPDVLCLWKIIPCEASRWILDETDLLQAHFILQAFKAKRDQKTLTLNEDSFEYKIFASMPSYVQEYLKKFYF